MFKSQVNIFCLITCDPFVQICTRKNGSAHTANIMSTSQRSGTPIHNASQVVVQPPLGIGLKRHQQGHIAAYAQQGPWSVPTNRPAQDQGPGATSGDARVAEFPEHVRQTLLRKTRPWNSSQEISPESQRCIIKLSIVIKTSEADRIERAETGTSASGGPRGPSKKGSRQPKSDSDAHSYVRQGTTVNHRASNPLKQVLTMQSNPNN